jgi:hypothetical protein
MVNEFAMIESNSKAKFMGLFVLLIAVKIICIDEGIYNL